MTKTRSNAKQRIIDVAFEHFVLSGYEGASLGIIAESVGIRKASIYTHFKSKDALFFELLEDALNIECMNLTESFYNSSNQYLPGEYYLRDIKSRYENSVTFQFLTRIAYVPPSHLSEHVKSVYKNYIKQLLKLYNLEFSQMVNNPKDQDMYADAYLGILDSLSVELLYDGSMYERRLHAMLRLYSQSIDNIIR